MFWYFHLFKNFPQFVVIHTVKGFGIVNKAEVFLALTSLVNTVLKILANAIRQGKKNRHPCWKGRSKTLYSKQHDRDFLGGTVVKNPSANAGDIGLILGLGRVHILWSN